MIRYLIAVVCLAWAAVFPVGAQQARECFTNMPDSLCPLLTAVNRADFIDFLDSNMKAEVTNRLGGKSEMTQLSPDYIRIQMTPQSSWQMKLLPVNDSVKVICAVHTACAPACDSHLRFYTVDWKELPLSDYLPQLPAIDDFIVARPDSVDVYKYEAARRPADMLLMEVYLSATDNNLTFNFTTPQYMDKEAALQLKPFLKESVSFVWKGGKFLPAATSL